MGRKYQGNGGGNQPVFRRRADRPFGDPARLGAQVICGIGFLGAGSIIVEGKTKEEVTGYLKKIQGIRKVKMIY